MFTNTVVYAGIGEGKGNWVKAQVKAHLDFHPDNNAIVFDVEGNWQPSDEMIQMFGQRENQRLFVLLGIRSAQGIMNNIEEHIRVPLCNETEGMLVVVTSVEAIRVSPDYGNIGGFIRCLHADDRFSTLVTRFVVKNPPFIKDLGVRSFAHTYALGNHIPSSEVSTRVFLEKENESTGAGAKALAYFPQDTCTDRDE